MSTESLINLPLVENDNLIDQDAIVFPKHNPKKLARKDILDGLKEWRMWMMLAYLDIKLRYRRSLLGPFWITISMAITVYSMGYLYGHLFHSDLSTYFPYLVGGMLSWALISGVIIELLDTFSLAENMIKQIKLPYSIYIHRVATRNFIVFFHNILVIVPVLFFFRQTAKVDYQTLLLFPGLVLIYINSISFGLVLAIIGARYRDVSQILKSLIQVVFFITPIMWRADSLPPQKKFAVLYNPFSSFVEIIRAPLIGRAPSVHDVIMVLAVTALGIIISRKMFVRYRARIVYWV